MSDKMKAVLITAIATIIAAAIPAAAAIYVQYKQIESEMHRADAAENRADDYAEKIRDAASSYTSDMSSEVYQIPKTMGGPEGSPPSEVERVAGSIVETRNDMRDPLVRIAGQLDSIIDEIQGELAKPNPDMNKVLSLLQTFRTAWPAKKSAITASLAEVTTRMHLSAQQ